ncbi:MAG TPA: glutathione S-transferase family protein [Dongiaceae bacterium]|nr:glutathione S-transferase family protein [Dongiaceae bacterium]
MSQVTVFGASYSVYVRIVRLVLEEARVPYELVEIDIFAKDSLPPDYASRHPFGRIPAFEHAGFRLFETDAIAGYILERFGDGGLLPADVAHRARMRQIMRIMDNYAYPWLVWGIFVEEMERDRLGQLKLEELERASKCLKVLSDLAADEYMAGTQLSLADLWALPMLAYLDLAPAGHKLLQEESKLSAWLARMRLRPAAIATRFAAEQKPI